MQVFEGPEIQFSLLLMSKDPVPDHVLHLSAAPASQVDAPDDDPSHLGIQHGIKLNLPFLRRSKVDVKSFTYAIEKISGDGHCLFRSILYCTQDIFSSAHRAEGYPVDPIIRSQENQAVKDLRRQVCLILFSISIHTCPGGGCPPQAVYAPRPQQWYLQRA